MQRIAIIGNTNRGRYGHYLDMAFVGVEGAKIVGLADPDDEGRAKAELEKQFQDILVLRQKVQQLQVELMASKKLEWLRRGFFGGARKKGGSQLMSMGKRNDRKIVSANADLNVEVRRDGTVKIVPIETNSPPNGATP